MIQDSQTDHPPAIPKKGSPWSGLGRKLTDEEWEELKKWRKENPLIRNKFGDIREDGMVFFGYSRRFRNGESWVLEKEFKKRKAKSLKRCRKLLADPAYRETQNKKRRERRKSDPEWAKKQKEWDAKKREKFQEGIRERKRNYFQKKYHGDPEYRKRLYEKSSAWRNKLPAEEKAVRQRKRHIVKEKHTHPHADAERINDILRQAGRIQARMGGVPFHVDHIIPISRGGWHHELNLQVIPRAVNIRKGSKLFWTSAVHKDWRDVPEYLWPSAVSAHYKTLIKYLGHPLKP